MVKNKEVARGRRTWRHVEQALSCIFHMLTGCSRALNDVNLNFIAQKAFGTHALPVNYVDLTVSWEDIIGVMKRMPLSVVTC